jgi:hypothetical protein
MPSCKNGQFCKKIEMAGTIPKVLQNPLRFKKGIYIIT